MTSDALVEAYLLADYGFAWRGGRVALRVGVRSADLAACLSQHAACDAALITASNPRSEVFDSAANQARHGELLVRLHVLGLKSFPADGRDPRGRWPAEASLLILNPGFAAAAALAAEFGQNAFLYCAEDATPRLVLGEVMAASTSGEAGPTET